MPAGHYDSSNVGVLICGQNNLIINKKSFNNKYTFRIKYSLYFQ